MTKLILFTGLLAVLVSGCSKTFLDVNENPNTTTSAPAINVFTGALSTTGNTMVAPITLAVHGRAFMVLVPALPAVAQKKPMCSATPTTTSGALCTIT